MSEPPRDPWAKLAAHTPARIALGRAGASPPTRAVLGFALAHAQARDAVHAGLDLAKLSAALAVTGRPVITRDSAAPDRMTYLRRPDLGRRLAATADKALNGHGPCDVAFVVADGLSAHAVMAHAAAVITATLPRLSGLAVGPIVVARQARVAIGDPIGAALGARLVIVLIGERPGLTAADSLGAYLTFDPKPGRTDAERNCLSNIHGGGLSADAAAHRLVWLTRAALTRGLSGVDLKDGSDTALPAQAPAPALPAAGPAPHKGAGKSRRRKPT
jgi:ethanolamine ammonia-lyase small subunit